MDISTVGGFTFRVKSVNVVQFLETPSLSSIFSVITHEHLGGSIEKHLFRVGFVNLLMSRDAWGTYPSKANTKVQPGRSDLVF